MNWQLAPALAKLRDEVNQHAKKRSKKSDGTIGDAAHSARESDHNPNENGIVCAVDFTHDPKGNFNAHKFADLLRLRCQQGQENRVNYIISKSRISSVKTAWNWVEYEGSNPHDKHIHISLKQEAKRYNNPGTWWVKNWME